MVCATSSEGFLVQYDATVKLRWTTLGLRPATHVSDLEPLV